MADIRTADHRADNDKVVLYDLDTAGMNRIGVPEGNEAVLEQRYYTRGSDVWRNTASGIRASLAGENEDANVEIRGTTQLGGDCPAGGMACVQYESRQQTLPDGTKKWVLADPLKMCIRVKPAYDRDWTGDYKHWDENKGITALIQHTIAHDCPSSGTHLD